MTDLRQGGKAATGGWRAAGYLAAGLIGVACAGLVGRAWEGSIQAPAANLRQALFDFDTGRLAAATSEFRTLADAGNPLAAYWYGHALDLGLGTPADPAAAITQFEKAWAGGVTQAGVRLGELYLDGNAVPPRFVKARGYLTAAARLGNARAALDLGRMLKEGIGGAADPVAAYAWLEVASLRGDAKAEAERDQVLATLSPAQQLAASRLATANLPALHGHAGGTPAKAQA
jgi:TPR repeat protein